MHFCIEFIKNVLYNLLVLSMCDFQPFWGSCSLETITLSNECKKIKKLGRIKWLVRCILPNISSNIHSWSWFYFPSLHRMNLVWLWYEVILSVSILLNDLSTWAGLILPAKNSSVFKLFSIFRGSGVFCELLMAMHYVIVSICIYEVSIALLSKVGDCQSVLDICFLHEI